MEPVAVKEEHMKLNDVAIKVKLLSVYILLMLAFISAGAVYFESSNEISKNTEEIIEETEFLDFVWSSALLFIELTMPANDYLIDGSPEELMNFERISKKANDSFAELKKETAKHLTEVSHDPEAYQKEIERAEGVIRDMVLLARQIFDEPNPVGKKDLIGKMKHLDALSLELKSEMANLAQVARADISVAEAKMSEASNATKRAIVLAGIFSIILLIFLGVLVQYVGIKRIRRLVVATNEYGSGNFDYQLLEDGKDELGVLARSFHEMAHAVNQSRARAEERGREAEVIHRLLQKLDSSLDVEFIMQSVAEALRGAFPNVTVSYLMAPLGAESRQNSIYVYAHESMGERYADSIKNTLLLGLDSFPMLKVLSSGYNKWKSAGFNVMIIEGGKSVESETMPMSSINIPLVLPHNCLGLFNFSSDKDGVFSKDRIGTMHSIIDCASDANVRLQLLIDGEKGRLVNLIDSVGDGVIVVDRNWNITLVNKAASQIIGYTAGEVLGRRLGDVFVTLREQDRKEHLVFIEKAMVEKTNQKVTEQTVLISKDGREIPVSSSASPSVDHNGNVFGAIVVFSDITKEQQEHGLKSDFAYASHQLRTPVSKAMWNLESALETEDIDSLKNAAMVAYSSIKSIKKLSEELLDVSRLDQEEVFLEKENVIISNVITEATIETRRIADIARVELIENDIEKIEIITNKKLLLDALNVVLDNAVIYNHAGGRVEIKVKKCDHKVVVEVIDNGIGIPEENRPLVFTKFFRGSNFDTTAITGAGLGLYIAKEYVTILGGKIWFESEEGKGTTFFISLPIG